MEHILHHLSLLICGVCLEMQFLAIEEQICLTLVLNLATGDFAVVVVTIVAVLVIH